MKQSSFFKGVLLTTVFVFASASFGFQLPADQKATHAYSKIKKVQKHSKNRKSKNQESKPQGSMAEQVVDINTASAEQLTTLKGVGEKRAALIVDYRKQNGPFASILDLTQVKGISQKRLDKLKADNVDRIVLGRNKRA